MGFFGSKTKTVSSSSTGTSDDGLKTKVLEVLSTVQDPDLKRDLVSLGMIKECGVADGKVFVEVMLTTPACPMKEMMEREIREKVSVIEGVTELNVKMNASVRPVSRPSGAVAAGQAQGASSLGGLKDVAHVIAVSSGKGGVGKSTVATNLAVMLSKLGAKVGLLDADVYGPNIPTMLGVTEDPVLEMRDGKEFFIPPTAHGLKVMSMGFLVQGDQPVVWRGPMLHSILNQFLFQVDWGHLDYLIVDMPPGTGDIQISLSQLVPLTGAVLVTTPQEVSMQDVRKALQMFEKVRVPILGLVENMSYFKCDGCEKKHAIFGKNGGVLLSKKFGFDLLAQLPIDPRVCDGGDSGRPLSLTDESSEMATAMKHCAQKVAQKIAVKTANQAKGIGAGEIDIGTF